MITYWKTSVSLVNKHNKNYLKTKREKLGHLL